MKNDDVYVIAQDVDDIKLLGNEMQPYPRLPIKFQELCGKQVICKRIHMLSKIKHKLIHSGSLLLLYWCHFSREKWPEPRGCTNEGWRYLLMEGI